MRNYTPMLLLLLTLIALSLNAQESQAQPAVSGPQEKAADEEQAKDAPQMEAAVPQPAKQEPAPLQLVASEKQVSFDSEGKITVLDANLRTRYGLLPAMDGFVQALLFEKSDGFILAVTRIEDGKQFDERYPITKEVAAQLRAKFVSLQPAASSIQEKKEEQEQQSAFILNEKDGLVPFLATTTVWAGLYGAALPYILGGPDANWGYYSGISFLSAATAFTTGYFLTKDREMTRGMAFGSSEGAFRGAADGALFMWLIGGNIQSRKTHGYNYEYTNDIGMGEETYGRLIVASTMLFSMAEYSLGMWYAKKYGMRGGEAKLLGYGSLLGYSVMFELYSTIIGGLYKNDETARVTPALLLAGGVGGLFLANFVNGHERYTEGDVSVFSLGVTAATSLPPMFMLAAMVGDLRAYSGMCLLGTVGGAVGMHYLLRGLDFTNIDALAIGLGTMAGGLLGAGISLLATIKKNDSTPLRIVPLITSIGMIGGLTGMMALYYKKGKQQHTENDKFTWNFNINPAGFAAAMSGEKAPIAKDIVEMQNFLSIPASPIASFEIKW